MGASSDETTSMLHSFAFDLVQPFDLSLFDLRHVRTCINTFYLLCIRPSELYLATAGLNGRSTEPEHRFTMPRNERSPGSCANTQLLALIACFWVFLVHYILYSFPSSLFFPIFVIILLAKERPYILDTTMLEIIQYVDHANAAVES
jgi:hypothetical protein